MNFKTNLIKILACLLCGLAIFVVSKLLFVAWNFNLYSGVSFSDILSVLGNGLSMDLSISAYLTAIPSLLLCISVFTGSKGIIDRLLLVYFGIISLIISAIIIVDSVLYGYWGFKLDATPIFYFLSSPSAALASTEWPMLLIGPIVWLILSSLIFMAYRFMVIKLPGDSRPEKGRRGKIISFLSMIIVTTLLIIPIRGGVTVSTMNLSRVYFSSNQRLNHAAVNPAFSLMNSMTHLEDFSTQFRFLPDAEASSIFTSMKESPCDSVKPLLNKGWRPDVYFIILESFSSHLFPSLGGEPIATGLDSIANDGLLFTRFFASSFRTDRGLASIMSAYPGAPTASIMKFVDKTENLPSFPKVMKDEGGYINEYLYGGDANFTNMKAYLVNAGFDKIISDKDFPMSERLSKWGAHDDVLFARVKKEISDYDHRAPHLRVIQTSSSHEPFEVPYDDKGRFKDKRAKAFAFADSVTSDFIKWLKQRKDWDNTLVVIVPDHYGAYPDLSDPVLRHKIPLIMTGGALSRVGKDETVGSQTDIAATLLEALRLPHGDFPFSHNLMNPCTRHFAFFTEPSFMALIEDNDTTVYDLEADRPLDYPNKNLSESKAYLQTIYDDLSKR